MEIVSHLLYKHQIILYELSFYESTLAGGNHLIKMTCEFAQGISFSLILLEQQRVNKLSTNLLL